jgi:hypothetical protein
MTVRHAIMQVNYYVRIRTVFEDDAEAMTVAAGERRWVPLGEAGRNGAHRPHPQGAHAPPPAARGTP